MRPRSRAGVTLLEVLIAVTLLSLLSVGMLMAMRLGLSAFGKADDKLMGNRRAAGAQRIVQEEIEGIVPVIALCGGGPQSLVTRMGFFQGEPQVMRLVSTFSLQQGWRGQPQILEFFVIPGENGRGVRLVVNEVLYTGPLGAGRLCTGQVSPDGLPQFAPVSATPQSFVLADQLEYCRFSYLQYDPHSDQTLWKPAWTVPGWPLAVRMEMAPLEPDRSQVQPITVVAPIYLHRDPGIQYVDR